MKDPADMTERPERKERRLRCPLCGNDRFYLLGPGPMRFLVVLEGGRVKLDDADSPRTLAVEDRIGCTTCAFVGRPDELEA